MILFNAIFSIVIAIGCYFQFIPYYLAGFLAFLLVYYASDYVDTLRRKFSENETDSKNDRRVIEITNCDKNRSMNNAIIRSVIISITSLIPLLSAFYVANTANQGMTVIAVGSFLSLIIYGTFISSIVRASIQSNLYDDLHTAALRKQRELDEIKNPSKYKAVDICNDSKAESSVSHLIEISSQNTAKLDTIISALEKGTIRKL
ncbi:hypothetical protein D051_0533 [Vibrio parahaemolyticus VPCR-2010]|uniref:hypothetical protein n=1 Tax=Vibrio parahaemolyticus TaxID=670 RepID=UPI00038E7301|nr:hypothetical protein D051_0533 [Vibrio parahaemolyticus VPCR-2010]